MKNIKEYILEKFKIHKDINTTVFLVLYRYNFSKSDFDWEVFQTFDEVFDGLKKQGERYSVYKNVPNDEKIIKEFIKCCKDVKFDNISTEKFNSIMDKYGIKGYSDDYIMKIYKSRK